MECYRKVFTLVHLKEPPSERFNTVIYVIDKDFTPIAQAKVALISKFYILNKITDNEGKAEFLNLPFTNYTLFPIRDS